MSEFIISEERFRFGILDKVPVPNHDECILLYREESGDNGSIIISEGMRLLSAQVRRGKFNRKITVSMAKKSISQSVKVEISGMEMYFDVMVQVSYRIANVREFYFRGRVEEDQIKQSIRKAVKKYNNEFGITKSIELEEHAEERVEEGLREFTGLKFESLRVSVSLDEDAKKYIASDKEKARVMHDSENETDTKVFLNKQKEREMDSENAIYAKKLQKFMAMTQEYGKMAPLVDGYIEGGMDGRELYDYIEKNRGRNIDDLLKVVEGELLTHEEAASIIGSILDDGRIANMGANQQIGSVKEERIEQKEGQAPEEDEIVDGDSI